MLMMDEEDDDILLDQNGQPVSDGDGDVETVSGDACWIQDLQNEAMTEEGELFYEDEEDDEAYGFGLLDFVQVEDDENAFLKLEIEQRIRAKLEKRAYIDGSSVVIEIETSRDSISIYTSFKRVDDDTLYHLNIDVSEDKVEVSIE